ncbi:MAG TPA: UvrD-helicase domain-containing protein [Edaphobacter sp.]
MAELFAVPSKKIETPDSEARERALDVERSWIVEAPAGSGKTGLLIQRYLKLLGHESVGEPEQVLAITFTKKATAEIRDRVVAQLELAARNAPLKRGDEFERETRRLAEDVLRRDERMGWGLLENPRRLRVQTIDAVCAEIARSLPVLSGGGGGQRPTEDAALLHHEAARRTLMQLGGTDAVLDEALRMVLLHRDGSLSECERLIAEMLALRDQWGELVPLGSQELNDTYLDGVVLPRLERTLELAVCAGLTEFAKAVPADFLQTLCSLAALLGEIAPYERQMSPIAICERRAGVPGTSATDLEHWRALIHLMVAPSSGTWRRSFAKNSMGFETTTAQKRALRALLEEVAHRDDLLQAIRKVDRLPPPKYPQEQWEMAKALFRVLRRALIELQLVFAQRGECDFAELGLLAKSALRREGGVDDLQTALGMKLQHLLVDEMQDTSTSQYELIELLTQGWDGRSQTVFLVGDPKQSIYMFRQARVERFIRTMRDEMLGELPLGCLRLTANFRSQSGLVKSFNEEFSLLFPREGTTANEVTYVEAVAVNGPSSLGKACRGVVWHASVLPHDITKRDRRQRARTDAGRIREIVSEWRARPLPEDRSEPWKIAVLVRSRDHLMNIVTALKADGGRGAIPFRAIDIERLNERQEVLDLFALTRALLHPADRVAWLAVLRAPWCGLGLGELHLLAGGDDPDWAERSIQDVISERGDLLSQESCERLQRIWPVLNAATKQRARMTLSQWVERTWRSLGGDAYLQPEEILNARRYLQLLDEVEEEGGPVDLKVLRRRMSRLFAEPRGTDGAVDLLTIHGAKGLEWDVVIVPSLEKKAKVSGGRLLTWSEIESEDEDAAAVVLAPIASKGEGSRELNDWLKDIHHAREAAERKRLYYVACTRAREELHLFAAPDATTSGEVRREHGSLLSAAWPAAERHFAAAPAAVIRMPFLPFPAPSEDDYIGDIAASAAHVPTLQRLPPGFLPMKRFEGKARLPYGDVDAIPAGFSFERPEGSFEARAFGNAVHGFLEMLAKSLNEGADADALLRELESWGPRITSVLRSDGLSPASVQRLLTRVMTALKNTLRDPEGLWILHSHVDAASEFALTSWTEARSSVRLDRVFRAGATPFAEEDDYLWIVDYKTTTHGTDGVEEFLAKERRKYAAQMEAYARVMKGAKVGLYYPMLPRFVWWTPEL